MEVQMKLLIGTTGICLAVLYFFTVLLLSYKERKSWWMSDALVANVHCILIISFLMTGVLMLIVALPMLARGLIDKMEVLSSIMIALATLGGLKIMRISKRMKEHRESSANVAADH